MMVIDAKRHRPPEGNDLMKTTAIANTGLSAWEVLSTPELARDLLPPTHPNGQHRMVTHPPRQCKSPLVGFDGAYPGVSIFAVAGGNGAEGLVRLVALG